MPPIGLVLAIAVSLSLLMFIALFYHKHLEFKQEQKNRARTIRQKAFALLEAFEYLIQVDNHLDIQRLVFNRIEDLYRRAAELDKQPQLTPADLETHKEKLKSPSEPRKLLQGPNEVRYMRRQFSAILKLLTPLVKRGDITASTMVDYKNHLRAISVEREVDTYMVEGDRAAEENSISEAANSYKIVRKRLMDFDGEYPDKAQKLKLVSDKLDKILGNEEEALSEEDAALAKALDQEGGVDEFGIPLSYSEGNQNRY